MADAEARRYRGESGQGCAIVTVEVESRTAEAEEPLRRPPTPD